MDCRFIAELFVSCYRYICLFISFLEQISEELQSKTFQGTCNHEEHVTFINATAKKMNSHHSVFSSVLLTRKVSIVHFHQRKHFKIENIFLWKDKFLPWSERLTSQSSNQNVFPHLGDSAFLCERDQCSPRYEALL